MSPSRCRVSRCPGLPGKSPAVWILQERSAQCVLTDASPPWTCGSHPPEAPPVSGGPSWSPQSFGFEGKDSKVLLTDPYSPGDLAPDSSLISRVRGEQAALSPATPGCSPSIVGVSAPPCCLVWDLGSECQERSLPSWPQPLGA